MNGFEVPIFLNCRDRLTDLRNFVTWLEEAGYQDIIMLDNASTYEPLLEFYERTPHRVVKLAENYGSKSLWVADMVPDRWFVFSDPDLLPIEECPPNVVGYLYDLLQLHPYPKAGLGLYLNDVPQSVQSLAWEQSLIAPARALREGVYDSMVDTTFAVYRPKAKFGLRPALRVDFPYQVRHLPWYRLDAPTEEERYYLDRAIKGPKGSSWAEGTQ